MAGHQERVRHDAAFSRLLCDSRPLQRGNASRGDFVFDFQALTVVSYLEKM